VAVVLFYKLHNALGVCGSLSVMGVICSRNSNVVVISRFYLILYLRLGSVLSFTYSANIIASCGIFRLEYYETRRHCRKAQILNDDQTGRECNRHLQRRSYLVTIS
jgi:hypothetical protein